MYKLFCICIIFFVSTKVLGQTPENTKIFLNPDDMYGGSASDLFSEIEYIPLQDSKESTVNAINKLEVFDKKIFVLDRRSKKVVVFDSFGKFLFKIDDLPKKIERKSNDYFVDLWLDRNQKKIILQVYYEKERAFDFIHFDLSGKYLQTDKQKLPYLDGSTFFYFQNDTIAVINENRYEKQSEKTLPSYHVSFFKGNKLLDELLPIDSTMVLKDLDAALSIQVGYDVSANSLLCTPAGSYKIYNINVKGIKDIYNLIFPLKYSMPKEILGKEYNGKRMAMAQNNKKLIFGLSSFFKSGSILMFETKRLEGGDWVFYDLKTSTAYELTKLQGDASNGYLPISSYMIKAVDGENNIYAAVTSAQMFKSKEEFSAKEPRYSNLLMEYFKTSSRLGNPVIVRMKIKSIK